MGVIEQGVFDAHFQPCASVYKAAVQSISSSSFTTATFDTERFDTDTIHDTVTNNSRLTCKTAGKYQITGFVQWPANATGFRQSRIVINGASNVAIMSTNGNEIGRAHV